MSSNNDKIMKGRCKSKRARSRQKSKHTGFQSIEKYLKVFDDNIRSYHLRYGFKNQQDFEECVNIHLTLLSCPLINSLQPQLNQYIIKEIAVFATGLIIQCQSCKSDNCALYGTTLNDKTLSHLCRKHNHNYTPSSIQAKVAFSKSMLKSFNKYDKPGYIFIYDYKQNQEYICNDCLPDKVAQALDVIESSSYGYCCMNGSCDHCRYDSDWEYVIEQDAAQWSFKYNDGCGEIDHPLAMERYYFATEYTNKIEVATMKCDNYLAKLKEGKSVRNFQSFNHIEYAQNESSGILKECEVCEGKGSIDNDESVNGICLTCKGIGSLNTKKRICVRCKDWNKADKPRWRWCNVCDNKGFHLVQVSWINDKPIDIPSYNNNSYR